jgi:hypothetical protein
LAHLFEALMGIIALKQRAWLAMIRDTRNDSATRSIQPHHKGLFADDVTIRWYRHNPAARSDYRWGIRQYSAQDRAFERTEGCFATAGKISAALSPVSASMMASVSCNG